LPGIEFIPDASVGASSCWLTCVLVDATKLGARPEELRLELERANIESRPCWKPMHLQPLFANFTCVGGSVSEKIFENGLCLPSGSHMTDADLSRVKTAIESATYPRQPLARHAT
jgi:pyridoxal phosphate-dependent aminotransferase EpsN